MSKEEHKGDFLHTLNKKLKAKPKVTVIYKFSHVDEGGGTGSGGGSIGGGLAVGDLVGGGGVVTAVTLSTVTVNFPNGAPRGPVRLPGVDTTIVVEESGASEVDSNIQAPWAVDDIVTPTTQEVVPFETDGGMEGLGLRTHYRLPRPGNPQNAVKIPGRVLKNPKNTSSCACGIWIASFNGNGQMIDTYPGTRLLPGETIPRYEAKPGAASIMAVCARDCPSGGDCVCQLSVDSNLVA